MDDKEFKSDILQIINDVIAEPNRVMITSSEQSVYSPSIKIQRDERTLCEIIQKDNLTFGAAKKALFDILEEKFNCCVLDASGSVTDALISYISGLNPLDAVNTDIFQTILDEILIDEKGEIALKFVTGATVGKRNRGETDESGITI